MEQRILLTECSDDVGLIAKVTGACFKYNFNVIRQDQYASHEDKKFFMRSVLEGDFSVSENFLAEVKSNLPSDAKVRLNDASARRKLAVLVTKESHCLGDILMKSYSGALNADIVMVAGNYPDLGDLAAKFNVPFHCISHEGISREEHEEQMCKLIDSYDPDYVVLAKYMRILSPKMVAHFPLGKLINIHHSFLPAFIGARPYHQAYERGVKIIGATAHYVNDNLDEGPIIMQDVIHVDHTYTAEDMMRAGRDVEKNVLSRALYKVLAQRVFVYGNRTIIL